MSSGKSRGPDKRPPTHPSVWELAAQVSEGVELSDWEILPRDGSARVDDYLYGAEEGDR